MNHSYKRLCVVFGLLVLGSVLLPKPAQAFKIDTHLWIGQQVINDLEDDGQLTIVLGARTLRLAVPAEVASAILEHRNEYLLGNVGPDAMPDVIAGQTLVHPGTAGGWKTNDWLRFLLTKSRGNALGTAFAFGYLGHAAADVFAHTYVNQYAGDIFELSDETLVEQRHVALESFISRFNPPLLSARGQPLGDAWKLVAPSEGLLRFVRDTLIYDPEAAGQHAAGKYTKHLAGYRAYREAIRAAADLPIWREIDNAVLRGVAAYYDIELSPQQAAALIDFLNDEVIPRVQSRVDLTQAHVDRLNAEVDRFDTTHYEALHGSLQQVVSLHSAVAQKLAQRAEADGKLCAKIAERACRQEFCCGATLFGRCIAPNPICPPVCQTVDRLQCPISEAVGNASADLIRSIDAELNGTNGLFEQLMVAATRLRDQTLIAKNNSLDVAQRLIDLGQVVSSDTSPIKAVLENWVGDVDVAMTAYVGAATNTMLNTMNPAVHELPQGAITPLVDWWDCHHLALMGLPAPVGTGTCGFRGSIERTMAALENIAHVIEDVALLAPSRATGLPSPAQVRAEIERLKAEATRQLKDAAIDALTDLLPQEVQDLIEVLSGVMTDDRLRQYFTQPETVGNKGLLMIGDVDRRVQAEMFVAPSGTTFDPERFAVVYDAVLLAKLALLDQAGLRALATQAGLPDLFAGTTNVVSDAFASIDGNHQWLERAPPRPKSSPGSYSPVALPAGYPWRTGYAATAGFVPWQPAARDVLFRALFIGPLSPGVESPSELGLGEVLPPDYPYRPCAAYPFPNDEYDTRCATSGVRPGAAPIASSIVLRVSASSVTAGASVTLTADVSGAAPTGSVVFFDNGTPLGAAPVVGGVATQTTAALRAGTHELSATYRGDGRNMASTAAKLSMRAEAPSSPPRLPVEPCVRPRGGITRCIPR